MIYGHTALRLERQKSLCAWIDTLQTTTISHAPLNTLPGPLGDDGPSGMAKEVWGANSPLLFAQLVLGISLKWMRK